jgi:hypothetical protein
MEGFADESCLISKDEPEIIQESYSEKIILNLSNNFCLQGQ